MDKVTELIAAATKPLVNLLIRKLLRLPRNSIAYSVIISEIVRCAVEDGVKLGCEQSAALLDEWQDTPTLLLACGEMTPQEIRTVKAALRQRADAIRNLP